MAKPTYLTRYHKMAAEVAARHTSSLSTPVDSPQKAEAEAAATPAPLPKRPKRKKEEAPDGEAPDASEGSKDPA